MPPKFAACSLRLEAVDQNGLYVVQAVIAFDFDPTKHIGPIVGGRDAVKRVVELFLDDVFPGP
jgi:hypothetical protein